jgi:uncharacterized protein (DUF488 family)
MPPDQSLWTVGHSTRAQPELIGVLRAHEIEVVVDVRRFPGSRRLPQFNAAALAAGLHGADIAYHWLPALGGRRTPSPGTTNTAWRHPAFRGYADHMSSDEFADGLFELQVIAGGLRTAVMCAEMLWWRCHRRLIADALTSLGYAVFHIRTGQAAERHQLRDPARVSEGVLSYEGNQQRLF